MGALISDYATGVTLTSLFATSGMAPTAPGSGAIFSRMPVVGLPYPLVLHPGLVLSVPMTQTQALALMRTALNERKANNANRHGNEAPVSRGDDPGAGSQQRSVFVVCLPRCAPPGSADATGANAGGDLATLFNWGCFGRVLRLVSSPTSEEVRLVVTGISRVRVERQIAPYKLEDDEKSGAVTHAQAPIVAVVPYMDEATTTSAVQEDLDAAAEMRAAAKQLMDMLADGGVPKGAVVNSAVANVPLLAPSLAERVSALLRDTNDANGGMLADILVGVFGGTLVWTDRLEHLTLVQPATRVVRTTEMLRSGMERVRLMREVLTNVPAPLHGGHKDALLQSQIEAFVAQLAAVQPGMRVVVNSLTNGSSRSDKPGPIVRRNEESDAPPVLRRLAGRSRGGGPERGPRDEDEDEERNEVDQLAEALDRAPLSEEARKVCTRELKRLKRMPTQSMERSVIINYLETMSELPWDRVSSELPHEELAKLVPESAATDVQPGDGIVTRARKVLEADHYGLDKVKKRLLEYLAVLELKQVQAREAAAANTKAVAPADGEAAPAPRIKVEYKGPILLLVGPPGTGKTSIARSLAAALNRPFTRMSLGGVRDEAEIRGHRRTYVGAMPGSIVAALRKVKTSDCVMLLDEVDKLGSGNGLHGDPMAALLEVLDPEQNHAFKDHYINVPIDLSRVLFIATANTLDTISPPLLDRTETVAISGYTHDEKVAIARRHLLPKQVRQQGLSHEQLQIGDDVLLTIAMRYTREAGVRTMERRISDVVRAKAVQYAESREIGVDAGGSTGQKAYDPVVRSEDLEKLLGLPPYDPEIVDSDSVPGVATGMAYHGSGTGGILHIESVFMSTHNGALKLTGSLGDVIRESAEIAFSWVKAHAFALGITSSRDAAFPDTDVHLHLPAGAVPKDGPSAGIAMTCALVSLYLRVPLDPRVAMTGEVTLRGHVTPVGGIKEKVLGAHRAGITKVILPQRNRKEYEADLPENVRKEVPAVFVHTVFEALCAAFGVSLEEQINTLYGDPEGRRRLQELEFPPRL